MLDERDTYRDIITEGNAFVSYEEQAGTFADGEAYTLRRPTYSFVLERGEMSPETMRSPRVAPQMIGLGLLEAIAEGDIVKNADPDDMDQDGISGRPDPGQDTGARNGECRDRRARRQG